MSKILKSLLSLLILSSLVSCNKKPQEDNTPEDETNITNEVEVSYLMPDSVLSTPVYHITSNIEGPKVAIVGGIHGDEVAGWNASYQLIRRKNFKGEVLIIPYANLLGDIVVNRWPGRGEGNSVGSATINSKLKNSTNEDFRELYANRDINTLASYTYSDLNRAFPGKENGTVTEQLAYNIFNTVVEFNPDYCIDLHESLRSHYITRNNATYLGDLVIFGGSQSAITALDICDVFNEKYLLEGENEFEAYEGLVNGSFNNTMGKTLTNTKVFTIETTRENLGSGDTRDLNRRITQQLNILDIMFEISYNEFTSK